MNFSKLDAFMETLPACGIPGCELAVSVDGEIVYRKGVGFADSEKTRPVSNKDTYWIFSATKVITCIAAMRLVEEGKLRLDDPVSKYIPEFADMMIINKDKTLTPAKNAMTIEHLFTMTGGMTYNIRSAAITEACTPEASTLDIVKAMAKDPLIFEPGMHYNYSLCHDVLGAVIEVVTGTSLAEYFDELIFKPLGIVDMGFEPNEEQLSRMVDMYSFKNGTGEAIKRECNNEYRFTEKYHSGGAGLFATVDEYIKIITVIACGGTAKNGYRLLKPETIAMMQVNRLCDDALNDFVSTRLFGYGWGLCGRVHFNAVRSRSRSSVGEFGWDGAANAYVMMDPAKKVAFYYGTHIKGCSYGSRVIHPTITNLIYECMDEE